jgi:integrase
MASGTIERKCMKGHKKAEGRCSPRCVRWYPRIQRATPDGHGRRRFDYLGGYPTRAAARAALDQALGRQGDNANGDRANKPSYSSTGVGGPEPPTLNDLLDHWLAHLQTNKALRLRTIGRYRQLLAHHLRPYLGTFPVSALSTLQIQRLYDHLAQHGRKDGKVGGLGPRTIRQVHLCLHQALGYAMNWHDLPTNPATDAEPPAVPAHTRAALAPEQVSILLSAAHHDRRPWLRAFTILAAATGARTGELCGLEWHDLDLAAGTLQFRQALSSIDQQLATGRPRPNGTRGKLLIVGPLKTPASQAVLSLPTFAVEALRAYQREQRHCAPLRLLLVRPGEAPRPVELDLVLRTGRDAPVRPEHASRAFRAFAQAAGIAAHPHLLRHSLASAMAAAKEPASVIAGQLRHADGGTLASRTYIHQLPQTPPRLARLIEDLYGPSARQAQSDDRN